MLGPSVAGPHPSAAAQSSLHAIAGTIEGFVLDATGSALADAEVAIQQTEGASRTSAIVLVRADARGQFRAAGLPAGVYRVTAVVAGFARATLTVPVAAAGIAQVRLALEPAALAEEVSVFATRLAGVPDMLRRIPGSLDEVDSRTLATAHVFTINEALRKVSGLNVRDEEGFGLRPNIGVRGLNPTRSSKVLLLEDGIPLTYAPYGDNASYYHPPVERIESIEVLKGSGQIAHGPSTVGAVINYVTPMPPPRTSGIATVEGGSRAFFNGYGTVGSTRGRVGLLGSYMRRQGDGARDHTRFTLDDVTGKAVVTLSPAQMLTVRGSHYRESSQITYSGLRQDEYVANPRQNPFQNDTFAGNRTGTSATHAVVLSPRAVLSTNVYASRFDRDWWRQSSNSAQRPNDAADPLCGGMANLLTTCGNEGRLRGYSTAGVEPRVRVDHRVFGVRQETDFGVRLHTERQDRRQENGETPSSRSGRLVERNLRDADAYAAFVQHRLIFSGLTVTPGVRVEHVRYARTNLLANDGVGASGRTSVTQLVPGVGIAHGQGDRYTVFAGVHRGFAPPRTEDVITNQGGVVDLDPELSWNSEVGIRSRLVPGVHIDGTVFRMDYANQLVPASLAGGIGAALTNGGQTLHQGVELTGRVDAAALLDSKHDLSLRAAYTWLPVARFTGARFSNIIGFAAVDVSGNRLPYAPEHTLTTTATYRHSRGLHVLLEAVHLGRQFADDLNTVDPTPDGQRGLLVSNTLWNVAVDYRLRQTPLTLFATVKNVGDATVIVDRSRGVLPGMPRLVQVGARLAF
ncbi:MAG: TonB-dependent receptor [Acidobacteria bacterium]|nr:TonB-dependent receptor [Acidobacteriota bacterium]